MAENGMLFRTAMGGFNKADVMAYLDKQNADFKEFTARQNDALAEKDAKINELNEKLTELSEKLDGMQAAADEAEKLREQVDSLRGELGAARAAIDEKDAQIEELKNRKPEATENDRKAGLYDDMSAQLGDILIAANKSADDIIAEANEKAKKITEDAVRDAENAKRSYVSRIARIAAAAKNNAHTATDNFRDELIAEIEEMRELLSEAVEAVGQHGASFAEKAEKLEKRLSTELDCTVSEIDREIETLKNEA